MYGNLAGIVVIALKTIVPNSNRMFVLLGNGVTYDGQWSKGQRCGYGKMRVRYSCPISIFVVQSAYESVLCNDSFLTALKTDERWTAI